MLNKNMFLRKEVLFSEKNELKKFYALVITMLLIVVKRSGAGLSIYNPWRLTPKPVE